ncbi:MAG: hypothetical protein K6T83_15500 [Alicyclobacillus sp.]|nr:hypothetical protein [Alicyclobacillus sp.]
MFTGGMHHLDRHVGRYSSKIEFSCLDDFIEDVQAEGIVKVHLDLLENVHASELSFIYYVSLDIVVTAQADHKGRVYEYSERVSVQTTDEPKVTDLDALAKAQTRLAEVKRRLTEAGFQTRHGRIVARM